LSALSTENRKSLDAIETALFAVCLDDAPVPLNPDESHYALFHNGNGHNRWFDKPIQLIVSSNGRAGVNGEHTPADAVVPGSFFNRIVQK
jgi:hypothetical protein